MKHRAVARCGWESEGALLFAPAPRYRGVLQWINYFWTAPGNMSPLPSPGMGTVGVPGFVGAGCPGLRAPRRGGAAKFCAGFWLGKLAGLMRFGFEEQIVEAALGEDAAGLVAGLLADAHVDVGAAGGADGAAGVLIEGESLG